LISFMHDHYHAVFRRSVRREARRFRARGGESAAGPKSVRRAQTVASSTMDGAGASATNRLAP
jgi:hypothetical protein